MTAEEYIKSKRVEDCVGGHFYYRVSEEVALKAVKMARNECKQQQQEVRRKYWYYNIEEYGHTYCEVTFSDDGTFPILREYKELGKTATITNWKEITEGEYIEMKTMFDKEEKQYESKY